MSILHACVTVCLQYIIVVLFAVPDVIVPAVWCGGHGNSAHIMVHLADGLKDGYSACVCACDPPLVHSCSPTLSGVFGW